MKALLKTGLSVAALSVLAACGGGNDADNRAKPVTAVVDFDRDGVTGWTGSFMGCEQRHRDAKGKGVRISLRRLGGDLFGCPRLGSRPPRLRSSVRPRYRQTTGVFCSATSPVSRQ